MKNLPLTMNLRDHERGAVAIVIAVMWTALFGLAVMAVDFGYLYTKKRSLQSVADAVLKAAMPSYASNNGTLTTQARYNATQMATLSGYVDDGGATTAVQFNPTPGPPSRLEVTISRKHPTFFAGIFGMQPRQITATAVGEVTSIVGTPAIHAQNSGCGLPTWGLGFYMDGNASLTVNGDVQGNGQIFLGPGPGPLGSITGAVKTPCAPEAPSYNQDGVTIAGGQIAVPPFATDPINVAVGALNASCTPPMSVNTTMGGLELTWTPGALCDTPANKVYCSDSDIIVSPPGLGKAICAGSKATFISKGRIIVGADIAINLQPATGAPNQLIFASYDTTGGGVGVACGAAALDMGASGTFDLVGNVYAPAGCIKIAGGGTGGLNMTGSLVGWNIELGTSPGPGWTFTGPGGGGGGGSWKTVR
jgi:hypothetical protein